ncbi:UNVERIFIED_ORG: hypothetical protein QOE_0009 [Clostridioides difficile F501]
MSQRVAVCGEVKVLNRAAVKSEPFKMAYESHAADAKPGELSMGRLKRG